VILTGANNRRIQVLPNSATRVTLGLDLDGTGGFERRVRLNWTDLTGPSGSDLGDTDGDGMHNGWEIAHNLNPNDGSDALADTDGDGATNLAEYQGGSDPRSNTSLPPGVGLSIQATRNAPNPAFVGGNLTYTLTVNNSGSEAANDVAVTDPLPTSVNLVSANATQGACVGTSTVTCSLGTVNGFSAVTVTIMVSPTTAGTVINTATVSTSSFDPFAADNSATSSTLVGLPGAGIQGLIDLANPGDTIIVDPGTYTGPINMASKNVTLRSRDGAATTIINGNGGTGEPVVQMGSAGGALIGFTITGGNTSFGAGVHLLASATALIADNVFDGNLQGAGGYGAAIGGNAVGFVTIERNVFRNNSCDTQFLSGVVSFINNSSPRIVNNVFANNPCTAVNLSAANGPHEVINNTFVANRTGILLSRFTETIKVYRNNILVENDVGVDVGAGTVIPMPNVWTNNLVFASNMKTRYAFLTDPTGTNGNIAVDPLFVNQAAGNYDLQALSPAINTGSSLGAPAVDIEGVTRLGGVDIGAFEGP
jgi:uncharacterized repeat protein (TIGR01451 family)